MKGGKRKEELRVGGGRKIGVKWRKRGGRRVEGQVRG